jgi:predicted TIM-barrel fold metal-dependent hydrolase
LGTFGLPLNIDVKKEYRMNIIDAHFHFCDWPDFDRIALAAGHVNSAEHLQEQYARLHIVHGVVMGNRTLALEQHQYPPFMSYCIGLDSTCFDAVGIHQQVSQVELHLQRKNCVGIKLYPGYNHFYVYDDIVEPFYELAAKYHKPVAIHTGLTATSDALLKYSHPLTLDEAAVRHPDVQFIMCHIGNPFLQDAIAVLEKNQNVAVDLSGLLEGKIADLDTFFHQQRGYLGMLRDWLLYLNRYDSIMFGTDWPLANLEDYIAFVKHIIPEEHWQSVFFDNANRIYQLGL